MDNLPTTAGYYWARVHTECYRATGDWEVIYWQVGGEDGDDPEQTAGGLIWSDNVVWPHHILEWGEKIERGAYQKGRETGFEIGRNQGYREGLDFSIGTLKPTFDACKKPT